MFFWHELLPATKLFSTIFAAIVSGGVALDDIHCNPFIFLALKNAKVRFLSYKCFLHASLESISEMLCVEQELYSPSSDYNDNSPEVGFFCPDCVQCVPPISRRAKLHHISAAIWMNLLVSRVFQIFHLPIIIGALSIRRGIGSATSEEPWLLWLGVITVLRENPLTHRAEFDWCEWFFLASVFKARFILSNGVTNPTLNHRHLPVVRTDSSPGGL